MPNRCAPASLLPKPPVPQHAMNSSQGVWKLTFPQRIRNRPTTPDGELMGEHEASEILQREPGHSLKVQNAW